MVHPWSATFPFSRKTLADFVILVAIPEPCLSIAAERSFAKVEQNVCWLLISTGAAVGVDLGEIPDGYSYLYCSGIKTKLPKCVFSMNSC